MERLHKKLLINTKEDEWIITHCGDSCTLRNSKDKEYYYCTSYVRSSSCTNHSIRKDKLIEKVLQELNAKLIKKKIKTITCDVLMKNIDEIIIYENKKIKVKFK